MSTVKATINAGVCGFVTEVTATCEDSQHVSFEIATPCEKVQKLAQALPTVDADAEIGSGFGGQVMTAVRGCFEGCCSGCAVPIGVFKAMQVAAGLALPQTVTMEFVKQP
jgi:hypothetical protein